MRSLPDWRFGGSPTVYSATLAVRAAYGAKRTELVEGLTPLAARGWARSSNPAGLHLLVRHPAGDHVRAVAAASSLDLALLAPIESVRGATTGCSFVLVVSARRACGPASPHSWRPSARRGGERPRRPL